MSCGLLWGFLINHLAVYWNTNPQYSYGWYVAPLCVYLFWRRWQTRPPAGDGKSAGVKFAFVATAFLFLPTWLLEQANPDWRFVSWGLAGETVVISLCAAYFYGGLPWMKHFAFPIVFICSAVPWPFGLELAVVQNLMRGVAAVAVEALGVCDIAALRHGNLIEVRTGVLGVDEACSGVRSLQAALMISFFLGEFFRFTSAKRVGLVLFGVLAAIGCNIARAFLLSWIASRDGLDAVSKWHDPAGLTIQVFCFMTVWLLAVWWRSPDSGEMSPPESAPPRPIPAWLFPALAFWILVSAGATEIWYRLHEGKGPAVHWTVDWTRASGPVKPFRSLKTLRNCCSLLKEKQWSGVAPTCAHGEPFTSNGTDDPAAPGSPSTRIVPRFVFPPAVSQWIRRHLHSRSNFRRVPSHLRNTIFPVPRSGCLFFHAFGRIGRGIAWTAHLGACASPAWTLSLTVSEIWIDSRSRWAWRDTRTATRRKRRFAIKCSE